MLAPLVGLVFGAADDVVAARVASGASRPNTQSIRLSLFASAGASASGIQASTFDSGIGRSRGSTPTTCAGAPPS